MIENGHSQFIIPPEKKPSSLRRIFRRTLYLRLLDGEFILWCFETDNMVRQISDLLGQKRVVVSDTQEFAKELLIAMNKVGVGSVPFCRRILVLHCFRFQPESLTKTEEYALYEMWKKFGRHFYLVSPVPKQFTDSSVVEICYGVGALIPKLNQT